MTLVCWRIMHTNGTNLCACACLQQTIQSNSCVSWLSVYSLSNARSANPDVTRSVHPYAPIGNRCSLLRLNRCCLSCDSFYIGLFIATDLRVHVNEMRYVDRFSFTFWFKKSGRQRQVSSTLLLT